MTEAHPMACAETAEALFTQWSPHWDLTKPCLVEKTPINVTRTRLFQALFPGASFVILVRHPAAVALATYNALASSGTAPDLTLTDLIEHWLLCYETFQEDAPHLKRLALVRYETFAQRPQETMDALFAFLNLSTFPCGEAIDPHVDTRYQQQWCALRDDPRRGGDIEHATAFEERVQRFGYSLREWSEDAWRGAHDAATP